MILDGSKPSAILLFAGLTALVGTALLAAEGPSGSVELESRPQRGLKADVATLLVNGVAGGPLPVAVLAEPEYAFLSTPTGGQQAYRVPIYFEVEGRALLESGSETFDRLDFYAYAVTEDGGVRDHLSETVALDLDANGEALFDNGLKFASHLDLPAGQYLLRCLVLEPVSRRYALRILPLEVAAPGAEARIFQARFHGPDGYWLVARRAEDDAGAAPSADHPSELGSSAVGPEMPSALPVLKTGESVSMHLYATALDPTVGLSARLVPSGGAGDRVGGTVALELRRGEMTGGGLERITASMNVPELESGSYDLIVSVDDKGNDKLLSTPALETIVLNDVPAPDDVIWSQIRAVLAAAAVGEPTTADLDLPDRPKRRSQKMSKAAQEEYKELLGLLASGINERDILERLVSGESLLFEQDPDKAVVILRQAQLGEAVALSEVEGESLLPLVMLHLDAYLEHRRSRQFALAAHARKMSLTLIELYVEVIETDESMSLAAGALAVLANYLDEARLWRASQMIYEQALALDENSEAALTCLASSYEKFGDYRRVVQLMGQLIDADPKAAEARVRLAVNLERLGREPDAERVWRKIIREKNPDMALSIAYQQLARLLLSQDRSAEAAQILREGINRLPEQQRLYILLSFVLERMRRFESSWETLARMPVHGGAASTPRHLYIQPPRGVLEPLDETLRLNARIRLPLLAMALDRAGG